MESSIFTGDKCVSVEKWARNNKIDPELTKSIVNSVKEPEEAPYLLETIVKSSSKLKWVSKKEIRNGLIRMQVHFSINSDSDHIKAGKQLFIAQVLEKLLFGSNLLLEDEIYLEEKPAKRK